MSRDEDQRLLLEMVRDNALLEELQTEGFTSWEIDAARAKVERADAARSASRRREAVVTSSAAPSSSVAVTDAAGP